MQLVSGVFFSERAIVIFDVFFTIIKYDKLMKKVDIEFEIPSRMMKTCKNYSE